MPGPLRARSTWLGLLILLGACGRPASQRPQASGAVVHRNLGDLGQLQAPPWHSEVLFTTLPHDSMPLGRFVDARFGQDTTLVTHRETQLLVFGLDGRLLHTIGREGDGPGEYRLIFRLGLSQDGTLFVADFATGRLTELRPIGPRVIPYLGHLSPTYEVEPLTLLPEGRILATFWQQRPNREEAGLQAGAFERDSAPLLLFDSAGAIRATLGVWPGLERARVSLEGADARLPPPYGRTVLAQGRGSWVAITPTDSLDLSLYSDTALVLRLTSTRPTARPTPELIRAWEHTLTSDFPDVAPIYRRAIQAAPVIPSLPLIGALGLDGHGHIWLGSYTSPTDTLRQWIIVSDAGEVVGRIALPALHAHALPGHRELLDVYGDRIALRRETADGESFVEVRRVWP